MRMALVLTLLPVGAAADDALLRVDSGPRVFQVEAEEIASAEVAPSGSGEPMIWVALAPSRHEDWFLFTRDGTGDQTVVRLCGTVVSEVVIQSAMPGGMVGIIGPHEAELPAMLDLLTGRLGCGPTS